MTCGPDGCRDPRDRDGRGGHGQHEGGAHDSGDSGDSADSVDSTDSTGAPRVPRRPATSAATWTTMAVPGAISVLQLVGDIEPVLQRIADRIPDPGEVVKARFLGIDTGVIARVHPRFALLMPHGGVRIRERMEQALRASRVMYAEPSFGAVSVGGLDLYPEADDDEEADILEALARAASPMAVKPLLRAASAVTTRPPGVPRPMPTPEDVARGERLWRMVEPARLAIVGKPNAGKSTLLNKVSGHDLALSGPEPGLTRDAVAARIELDGLTVDWFDTPGLRRNADPIEAEAIAIADTLIRAADLVIWLAEPGGGWPEIPGSLEPAIGHLRVMTKADLPGIERTEEAKCADLRVSAKSGAGMPEFVKRLRELIVPQADLDHPGPWVMPRNTSARPMID